MDFLSRRQVRLDLIRERFREPIERGYLMETFLEPLLLWADIYGRCDDSALVEEWSKLPQTAQTANLTNLST